MATVVLLGATYEDVPAVQLPSTGGSVVLFYDATDGNNLEYGITDGSIPRVGIAQAGYAELES